ncbi:cysteine synthase [Desulfobotulus sp.]|jgi:cysteinyl-tRNA synthetase|uniref:cysteine synthase n=1 Tax=Desulfobotulus sp. TaxID=1940337 RepID=UPI002A36F8B6|nr:cysteine synthase [Desulfobotulus sp.]MDY0161811.1 cysteine synthase [Desulfobotulus sp.]
MANSLLDLIGNTPLVEIRRMNPNPAVRILAKLEYMNPGGSVKDRAALYMIRMAEEAGILTKDKVVIEATSGNTGIGLAMVCAVKGYRLMLAMSEAVSLERRRILKARGAEILLTPGHLGTDGAIEAVYRLVREQPQRYFMTDQYNTEANWRAHAEGTSREIWEQTQGRVNAVVATMGTTGTLMGLSRGLKALNPEVRIIGVEPYLGHRIQGLKNMKEAYQPELYEKHRLDVKVNIEDARAFETARRMAKEEGLLVGMSSGAAMAVAQDVAASMKEGVVVVMLPDSGERYLSTELFASKAPASLRFYNTLTRSRETFAPIHEGKTSIYSCGPTVHDRMHLGGCRRALFSDLLCRYLKFRGFDVTHVMNITDMDDKTIAGSEAAGLPLDQFTEGWIRIFHEDLARLGVEPAKHYPRVSEHLEDMVALTRKLVSSGLAYEKHHSIYFNISAFPGYGALSGVDLDKIHLGATVDLEEYEKDNPRDFTLLKRIRLSELKRGIYASTEWGNVRPSLHLQCAAMSMKYLGQTFDIHTSSRELVFPHHENEIAIAAAATGAPLARFWMHCDRVFVDGQAVGPENRLHLGDLEGRGMTDREMRFWLLSAHYRKPALLTQDIQLSVRRSLSRIDSCLQRLSSVTGEREDGEALRLADELKAHFIRDMDDDLNISAAMGGIFNQIRSINRLLSEGRMGRRGACRILQVFREMDQVLGFFNVVDFQENPDIARKLIEREAARNRGDWEAADRLRAELGRMGWIIQDGKTEHEILIPQES